tara:strand:+ start:2415 stop:2633 length:219 start_codon:yes stop_codon:yes gene_type:complete
MSTKILFYLHIIYFYKTGLDICDLKLKLKRLKKMWKNQVFWAESRLCEPFYKSSIAESSSQKWRQSKELSVV